MDTSLAIYSSLARDLMHQFAGRQANCVDVRVIARLSVGELATLRDASQYLANSTRCLVS